MPSNDTPKTCLQVLPELGTGGVERGTIDVAEALVGAGWRALVASAGGSRVRELERIGGEHITLPLASKSPVTIWKNVDALRELLEREGVSLVHARSRAPAWSAFRAARVANRPFVTTFHGVYGTGPLGLKKIYNRVMSEGDPIIAISDFIRRHVVKEYGVAEGRIVTVHRGVDLDLFDPDSVASARMIELSRKWRLPDDGPVIMLPGRFSSWKGQALLVDALSHLHGDHKLAGEWRCLLVGPPASHPTYMSRLKARIADSPVSGHIQVIDDCRDMAAAYMVTDVVVSGSTRPEAFGRIVAEAQAMGRPVVAPDHGGAPEILLSGVTGWLFTPGDAQSLAGALVHALSLDSSGRAQLAETGRARVAELFNKKSMVAQTLDIYDAVVQRGD